MKRAFFPYYVALFTLLSVCSGLKSQDLFVDNAKERFEVCTDRTMYASGEKVFFSTILFNEQDSLAEEFSRILYCELITPAGNKIAGGKYLLKNSSGQGCLVIPEEAISGIYFLKFYTRFMRNNSTDDYTYTMLKIINPFKTEVLAGSDIVDTKAIAGNNPGVRVGNQALKIISDKNTFSPRDEIRLHIHVNPVNKVREKLCMSVIPESTYEDPLVTDKNKLNPAETQVYFPETRGLSLSGQLIGTESGNPIPFSNVNLSIIGDKDILVIRTDSSGRFFFALPDYTGKKDIFLCASDLPDIKPEVLIDNDFCSKPVNLPSPLFTLNEDEMKAAYKLVVNSRITTMFREETMTNKALEEELPTSFFGEPTDVFIMEKYIDLPTLEEYFSELPVMLKLRKVNGKKQFRFYTTQNEMSFYAPLILVDWVAVTDITKILAMSPLDIERIEIVNSLYVKGNILYGGIISFVSKKNDFAGIDLPTSGTFVNYSFLEDCTKSIPTAPSHANIPDSRNTVYWNPDVQTNEDGSAVISFPAPDTPGSYFILLRGMSLTGEVVLTKKMFVVSDE